MRKSDIAKIGKQVRGSYATTYVELKGKLVMACDTTKVAQIINSNGGIRKPTQIASSEIYLMAGDFLELQEMLATLAR